MITGVRLSIGRRVAVIVAANAHRRRRHRFWCGRMEQPERSSTSSSAIFTIGIVGLVLEQALVLLARPSPMHKYLSIESSTRPSDEEGRLSSRSRHRPADPQGASSSR